MSKQGMIVKGMMDYASVVDFLEDFVKSFKEKTICVQRGEDFITLNPAENMEIELEASIKKGKQKLSIELEWREELSVENDVPFKVSAVEPEPQPKAEPEATSEEAAATSADQEKKAKTEQASASPKSVEVVSSPSILAPTPSSKSVVESKTPADGKDDKAKPAEDAKGSSKSAAKTKTGGAKKTASAPKK